MPLANATTKLAASGAAPTAARPLTALRASNTPLPAMMITASKKLNSAAASGDPPQAPAVHHQDGPQRRDMKRNRHEDERGIVGAEPHDGASHREMPRARHGQELREPLHQPQYDPLPDGHVTLPATSATIPTSIAPLSSRLFRALCPANRRLATASTASWANSAITKYAPP